MFFSKLQHTDNHILHILMHLLMVKYEMLGLAAKYGLRVRCLILDAVWSCFAQRVQFYFFLGFSCVVLFFKNVFVVFHCMVLLCALALCVYLCVGLLYIDIVYCITVSLYICMWLPVGIINDE